MSMLACTVAYCASIFCVLTPFYHELLPDSRSLTPIPLLFPVT
jgi:hypothetical protein